MIPAQDALRKIADIADQPDIPAAPRAVARELLEDMAQQRLYTPDYDHRPAQAVLEDQALGLHVGFAFKVTKAQPFKFQGIMLQLHQPFTPQDGKLMIRMVNAFMASHANGHHGQRVRLNHLPVPATSTGAFFIGLRQGEFLPISWIHEDVNCGAFACYLCLTVAKYLEAISRKTGRLYF